MYFQVFKHKYGFYLGTVFVITSLVVILTTIAAPSLTTSTESTKQFNLVAFVSAIMVPGFFIWFSVSVWRRAVRRSKEFVAALAKVAFSKSLRDIDAKLGVSNIAIDQAQNAVNLAKEAILSGSSLEELNDHLAQRCALLNYLQLSNPMLEYKLWPEKDLTVQVVLRYTHKGSRISVVSTLISLYI
jgi:hypothetical protein